jgi:hypothetical protein
VLLGGIVSSVIEKRRNPVVRAVRGHVAGLILAAVAVGGLVVAGLLIASVSLPNLLGSTKTEQQNAVVLTRIQDLARFQAATGRFQTIVDVNDAADHLPDWVKGEHKVLAAEGDVAAAVDFSNLGADAVEVSADGHQATVHLPAPTLQGAQLDRAATRVVARNRGVLDRIDDALTSGNPSGDDDLYARAEQKLADAAGQSDLTRRAEENTTRMMTGLLAGAGFDQVNVVYDAPQPSDPANSV